MSEYGLIVPDVHERIGQLKTTLEKYKDAKWTVFLGDFLDSFDGLTEASHETCKWLVTAVENPTFRFCFGNHDIHYAWDIPALPCSGYTVAKHFLVNSYVKRKHWDRFGLMHWVTVGEKEFLCSHAGIHSSLLHPTLGFDKDALAAMETKALEDLKLSQVDPLLMAGRGRGGRARVGGVDWLDWNVEFEPVPGLNQIVGHTPSRKVRHNTTPDSKNVCLDTDLRHVIVVEDGKMNIKETY